MPTLSLCDWKSSSFRSPEELLQLSAYWACPEWAVEEVWQPWEARARQAVIVQVGEKLCKPVVVLDETDLQETFEAFQHVKAVFDFLVKQGKVTIPQNEEYRIGDLYLPSVTFILSQVMAKPVVQDLKLIS